jgi:hypothetical protein
VESKHETRVSASFASMEPVTESVEPTLDRSRISDCKFELWLNRAELIFTSVDITPFIDEKRIVVSASVLNNEPTTPASFMPRHDVKGESAESVPELMESMNADQSVITASAVICRF